MVNNYLSKDYWNGLIKVGLSRLFILRVLYVAPLHGYGICRRISEITSGCCAPTESALYPVLHEFEKHGYVSCWKDTVGGRNRKVYALTEKGRRAYHTGLKAWEETAGALITAKEELSSQAETCEA